MAPDVGVAAGVDGDGEADVVPGAAEVGVVIQRRPRRVTLATKASALSRSSGWSTPGVSGKVAEVDSVEPVTNALPAPSTAMSLPASTALPPRKLAYPSAVPPGLTLATKASTGPPAFSGWNAPGVSGKVAAVEVVRPVT